MPRKREELSSKHEKMLLDLMSRGATVVDACAALVGAGAKISPATVGRRMRELQGKVNTKRARAVHDVPDVFAKAPKIRTKTAAPPPREPTEADLDVLDDDIIEEEIKRWRTMSDVAETAGDYRQLETAGRLLAMYLEQKRKRRRPEKVDPNDDPDLKARASTVIARLHDYATKAEMLGRIEVELPT